MKNSLTLMFCLASLFCVAQEEEISKVNLGLGLGLDYGGIGTRLTVTPTKNFGIFGSVGFAIAGAGYNFGLNGIFNPKGKAQGYLTGMYGYNAALYVKSNGYEYKNIYHGISFGGGLMLHMRNSQNFWNFELLIPVRDPAFQNQMNTLQNQGYEISEIPPIAISIGFHFKFASQVNQDL